MGKKLRGTKVIVRDFLDRPFVRVLWAIGDKCIYICSDDQFADLLDGDTSAPAIGFPKKDVFIWDDSIESTLSSEPFDWRKLNRFDVA
ncbi:MAG: hypothetical protein V3W04_13510 [Gammaproteobacteria bacterium]